MFISSLGDLLTSVGYILPSILYLSDAGVLARVLIPGGGLKTEPVAISA